MSGNGRHAMNMCVERTYVVAMVCDAYIYTTVGIYISFLVMTAMLRRITRHLYCIGGHDDF